MAMSKLCQVKLSVSMPEVDQRGVSTPERMNKVRMSTLKPIYFEKCDAKIIFGEDSKTS